ncbi:MAG: Franean1_4349 family RiPP [Chloroflexota bacterium]|nr:Franean1_4349 family RiPP [Chloroflexota bacterium]
MSETILSEIIGRAIVDPDFRRELLADPTTALSDFPLTLEEQQALSRCQANDLEQFAQRMYDWFTASELRVNPRM